MKEERMSVRDIKEGEFQWICFCDGIPWDFYVRKTSDSESVRLIESQMRQSLVNLLEDEPCIGYIYGVKWDQDSQYYRGEILEKLNEDLYMIRLIDYGNVEVQSIDKIMSINSGVTSVPPYAIPCCMKDLEEFRGTLCAPSVRENFHTWLGVGLPIEAQFFPQNGFYSVCLRIQLLSSLFCSVLAHETSPRVVSEKVENWILACFDEFDLSKENCLHDNSKQQESEYSSFEELMSRSNKAQETGSISGSQSSDSFSNPPSLNNQTKSIEELSKAMSKTLAISNETQNPTKEPERGQEYLPIQSTIPKLMDCYNYSENTELIRGSKINIYYTGGPGPEKFYSIFFNDHSIQYPEFYEEIQDYYNNSDEYEELYLVDYSPVAVYEYESWNRGEIRGDKVFLVDSGELLEIEPLALRKLNREFLKYPPLIKACKLYHPHGLSPQTFSKEGLEVFVNLFNEKTESVYIELEDANLHPRDRVYLISPLSENGIPFQCILKERGFGYFEFVSPNSCFTIKSDISTWDPAKKDYEEQNNTLAYRSDNIDCVLDQKYTIGPNGKEADPICKFYRSRRHCPQGNKCQFLHCALDDPKAFAGQDVTYDQLEELELPQIDSLVVAQVTTIISLSHFYIILPFGPYDIQSPSFNTQEISKISELNKELNNIYERKKVKQNSNPLFLGDVVVAKHSKDNYWYRARVINVDDDQNMATVFYVDYGEKNYVPRSQICSIDPRFLQFPFQAIECGFPIKNIIPFNNDTNLRTQNFFELISSRTIFAKVYCKENDGRLTVYLYYVNENNTLVDILEELMCMPL
ncbi:uncharacterized protein [Lepeophtheirus salmonis]|uniref:uncharacterized protein n=1 Tax=Lepeophtheirus salmonis TaxID=72036 RepID=UPI001AE7B6DA|nr:uncharacterized protein LOC121122559 [Lepeophtheirus salmonis]